MAKQIQNDKKFLVISCTTSELMKIEPAALGICDRCNNAALHGYLCCALGHYFYCEDCYNDWVKRATRYSEDIEYEQKVFNQYKTAFEKAGIWEEQQ